MSQLAGDCTSGWSRDDYDECFEELASAEPELLCQWLQQNKVAWCLPEGDLDELHHTPIQILLMIWDKFRASLQAKHGEAAVQRAATSNAWAIMSSSKAWKSCNVCIVFTHRHAPHLLKNEAFIKMVCQNMAVHWPEATQHWVMKWAGNDRTRLKKLLNWLECKAGRRPNDSLRLWRRQLACQIKQSAQFYAE